MLKLSWSPTEMEEADYELIGLLFDEDAPGVSDDWESETDINIKAKKRRAHEKKMRQLLEERNRNHPEVPTDDVP